jgi:glycerol-1-phosphatase
MTSSIGAPLTIDGLIVDLDGVVWRGGEPIPGSVGALTALRARGVSLVFLTNDPRGSPAEYTAMLQGLGFPAAESDVVTSATATATYVREREGEGASTFVIGSLSLQREVSAAGLTLVRGEAGRNASAVVVGGHEAFNYDELRYASQAIHGGARLYATGRDATFPMPDGPWPATGSILAAVETAGGREAVVVGKPEPHIFEIARGLLSDCHSVAIVGDNLDADITGGKRAGLFTVLVLTGTSSEAQAHESVVQPDLVVRDLARLAEAAVTPFNVRM